MSLVLGMIRSSELKNGMIDLILTGRNSREGAISSESLRCYISENASFNILTTGSVRVILTPWNSRGGAFSDLGIWGNCFHSPGSR